MLNNSVRSGSKLRKSKDQSLKAFNLFMNPQWKGHDKPPDPITNQKRDDVERDVYTLQTSDKFVMRSKSSTFQVCHIL